MSECIQYSSSLCRVTPLLCYRAPPGPARKFLEPHCGSRRAC